MLVASGSQRVNPLIPRSDRYVNSPYIFNTVKQTGNENEQNYQLGAIVLI